MSVLLVTYDLNAPGKDYSDLLKKIKENDWAKLSESSYAIKTYLGSSQIFDLLKLYIDQNDNLYVIELKKPYNGWGPKIVNEWLTMNLP